MQLLQEVMAGNVRALARALTLLEAGDPQVQSLVQQLRGRGTAWVVGLTGSPGAGKSTLADHLIAQARTQGQRVAVLAVDPSSAFTGGAILGDRIRMMRHHHDPQVYLRSLASRGALGGLAGVVVGALALLEGAGYTLILIETVGVGQSEIDIARVADSTVVVLTPAAGDSVQASKAGVMEIADIFVVNKHDMPGGPRVIQEVKAALELAHPRPGDWHPPVLPAVAAQAQGVAEVYQALLAHRHQVESKGLAEQRRLERARFEVESLLQHWSRQQLLARPELLLAVAHGQIGANEAVRTLLELSGNKIPVAQS